MAQRRWLPQPRSPKKSILPMHMVCDRPSLRLLNGAEAAFLAHGTRDPENAMTSINKNKTTTEWKKNWAEKAIFVVSGGAIAVCVCACIFWEKVMHWIPITHSTQAHVTSLYRSAIECCFAWPVSPVVVLWCDTLMMIKWHGTLSLSLCCFCCCCYCVSCGALQIHDQRQSLMNVR